MEKTIMIADDDPRIRSVVKLYLESEDFNVIEVENGEEVLQRLEGTKFDLILLDLMMPVVDGWTVCKNIRKNTDIPVIMLTAKGEENDRILGLDLGADDYIVKPFSPRELVARVKAVLRRSENRNSDASVFKYPGITVNVVTRQVQVNNEEIKFTLKEFDLLHLFIKAPGRVYTRDELLEQVWGYDYCGDTRTVDTHINRLREKITQAGGNSEVIQTVRGVGYKFLPAGGQ